MSALCALLTHACHRSHAVPSSFPDLSWIWCTMPWTAQRTITTPSLCSASSTPCLTTKVSTCARPLSCLWLCCSPGSFSLPPEGQKSASCPGFPPWFPQTPVKLHCECVGTLRFQLCRLNHRSLSLRPSGGGQSAGCVSQYDVFTLWFTFCPLAPRLPANVRTEISQVVILVLLFITLDILLK